MMHTRLFKSLQKSNGKLKSYLPMFMWIYLLDFSYIFELSTS